MKKIWFSRILVLVLPLLVMATGCRKVPEQYAASDKYRLVWNDDPTTTMTIIWDQLNEEEQRWVSVQEPRNCCRKTPSPI